MTRVLCLKKRKETKMAKHYLSSQFDDDDGYDSDPVEESQSAYNPELRGEPNDDIGPYDGYDYDDSDIN